MKRQIAYFLVIFIGFLTLFGHFINYSPLNNFIDNDATQWFDIISGFAAFLGVINLLQLHLNKISRKKDNWKYSFITLFGFLIMIIFGFIYNGSDVSMGPHLKKEGSAFYWMFQNIYLPLGATMFALLAFFVASASYRAFKIRNFEATLLLVSGVFLMIGRVPIGQLIPWWMSLEIYVCLFFAFIANRFNDRKKLLISLLLSLILLPFIVFSLDFTSLAVFKITELQEWIMDVPATAGSRAIMIGIALGTIAQSYRIITGREKSILGD
ncbi:MAG: hypothetical protein CMG39_03765 [Candidatus Marinimicrobia bacterium]|nr:hypothetical protein [Candidatus Neomarinimicrobiota bacterium]|tara:strand:+ start:3934 stop:4737 length:804 start_codon:yes stop_codon:yes gene_type:complete